MKITFRYSSDGIRVCTIDSIIAWLYDEGHGDIAKDLIRRTDEAFEVIDKRIEDARVVHKTAINTITTDEEEENNATHS